MSEDHTPLVCTECGAESPADAKGWRAYRAYKYDTAYDYFSPGFQSRVSRQGWVADKLRDRPTVSKCTSLGSQATQRGQT
jgi:hypothetical protein